MASLYTEQNNLFTIHIYFSKAREKKKTAFAVILVIFQYGRGGIRTHDLILKRDLLYQLSYTPLSNKQRQLIYRNIFKMQGKVFLLKKNFEHIKKDKEKEDIPTNKLN